MRRAAPSDVIPSSTAPAGCRAHFPLEGLNTSGGVQVIAAIANALAERGHEVRVSVPDYASEGRSLFGQTVKVRVICTRGSAATRRLRYAAYLCANSALDADVVYATGYKTPWYILFCKIVRRPKPQIIYFVQGDDTHSAGYAPFIPRPMRLLLRLVGRLGYKLPLTVITVSSWLRERIGRMDALVVPNGTEPRVFYPRNGFRKSSDTVVVGLIGSHAPNKGYSVFVAAARTLQDADCNCRFLVATSDDLPSPAPFRTEFIQPIAAAGMAEFYNTLDVFLFTSFSEGFGLPPLEAMACGVPVIVTDCGGVREYATAENSIIVPSGDPHAMASALKTLISDRSLRSRLAAAGRMTAETFSASAMRTAHVRVFEHTCAHRLQPQTLK